MNRYSNEKKLSSSGPGQVKVMRRSDEVQEGQRKDLDLSYINFWFFGGPCDYCVSPSPFGLDFGTSDSGLTILIVFVNSGAMSRFLVIN